MKIKCLLVDDEPPALKVLQSHIEQIGGLEVVGVCANALEALEVLHERVVDLMFLDIKMPKLLGTQFLKSLTHAPKVIFVTAYRDFAAEGFELDAVDYLVKPVSFERFVRAISKVKRLLGQEAPEQPETYTKNPESFVYLKVDRNMQKFLVHEILFLESWKDYVKVFLMNGKHYLVKHSISSLETMLSDHSFLRVHRSFMISLDKVTGFNNSSLSLGKQEVPIGRLYKQHVMDVIKAM